MQSSLDSNSEDENYLAKITEASRSRMKTRGTQAYGVTSKKNRNTKQRPYTSNQFYYNQMYASAVEMETSLNSHISQ